MISAKMFKFLLVGVVGFFVDASVLVSLEKYVFGNYYISRVFSFSMAVFVTWLLNRNYTFNSSSVVTKRREYSRYLTVQIFGAVTNLAVFFVCLEVFPPFYGHALLFLALGAGFGMVVNFIGSAKWVFKGE